MRAPHQVAIVTDSTCGLDAESVDELGIGVIPLRVSLGERGGVDGAEITGSDVARALRAHLAVRTSRPTPAQFAAIYESCLAAGASAVVSIHLAAALSGTWESATLAAQDFAHGSVRVVDSRATAMGLGFAVLAAARAAAGGAGVAEVQGTAVDTIDRTDVLFYVDTLEYLRRGGRIGAASALLATSLSVKPILRMVEGSVVALEKVRTPSKALARLVRLAAQAAGDGPVDLAVHHLDAPERAELVAGQLRGAVTGLRSLRVSELGPVVGAHLGPGVIGVVVCRG